MNTPTLIAEQLLTTIAYGDSAGLSFEKRSRQEILAAQPRLTGLVPINNKFIGELPKGAWSDDTQLSLAVAEALIAGNGFDMDPQVLHHLAAWRQSTRGWGGTTRESLAALDVGVHWSKSGSEQGQGNGVLMKMAPLVLFMYVTRDSSLRSVEQLTALTHNNAQSIVNSVVHTRVLHGLIDGVITSKNILTTAAQYAQDAEVTYKAVSKTSELLSRLAAHTTLTPDIIVDENPKGGFHSSETLGMAYANYALEPSLPATIFSAVELGGDTDSIASIGATMALFANPEAAELPDDAELLEQNDRLKAVGQQLANLLKAASERL